MNKREAAKLLSALILVLGGGILTMGALGLLVGPWLFGPLDEPLHGLCIVLVLPFALSAVCLGMVLGAALTRVGRIPTLPRAEPT